MPRLYMFLAGCLPTGRNTEQHDVYFAIGSNVKELLPGIIEWWPEAGRSLHIDAWRVVSNVEGFGVHVTTEAPPANNKRLFFLNLGGYRHGEFEEFHYKIIVAANSKGDAIRQAKQTAFYRHTGFKGAPAHIDDKYGVDVDDVYEIQDILPAGMRQRYHVSLQLQEGLSVDEIHLGYFKPDAVDKWSGDS